MTNEMLAGDAFFAGSVSRQRWTEGFVRAPRELAFFCHPVAIFFAIWTLMLGCLAIRISYVIYPDLGLPVALFLLSAIAYLMGYGASAVIFGKGADRSRDQHYSLNLTALSKANLILCGVALAIIALNWVTAGAPPALSDPSTYLTYGRFRQILFPVLASVIVNSTLETSWLRRLFFLSFGVLGLVVYVTRDILLISFLQMFFVHSLRTQSSRKKQYLLGFAALAFAVAGTTIFGNLRTAHEVFITFMRIRDQYAHWPMAWLWIVSYVSVPFSNLCWLVAQGEMHGPSLAFLYAILPSFVVPAHPYAESLNSFHLIDNASTYLLTYALDFSLLGIYFANLALGVCSRWIVACLQPRHLLLASILLTSLSLIFFSDMFFLLSTAVQLVIQGWVERRCFAWEN